MDFAATLRAARLDANLTQAELARRSATSQATLCAYESGRKTPSVATFERILAAAGRRLSTQSAARDVFTPSSVAHRRVAASLHDVLALAAALPSRPAPTLTYPRLAPNTR